jgi:hypothetical protein
VKDKLTPALAEAKQEVQARYASLAGLPPYAELMVLPDSNLGAMASAELNVKITLRDYKWVINFKEKDPLGGNGTDLDAQLVPVEH